MEKYLTSLVKVLGIGAAFAAVPLFASLASLQPPWPPAIGFVSAALVMLSALIAWEWTRNTKLKNRRKAIIISSVGVLISLTIYLIFYSLFVETVVGKENLRIIRGYECNTNAKLVFSKECPDLSANALEQAEWDSLALWTRQSITIVRMSLTLTWLAFTGFLISAVGSIVAGRKF